MCLPPPAELLSSHSSCLLITSRTWHAQSTQISLLHHMPASTAGNELDLSASSRRTCSSLAGALFWGASTQTRRATQKERQKALPTIDGMDLLYQVQEITATELQVFYDDNHHGEKDSGAEGHINDDKEER